VRGGRGFTLLELVLVMTMIALMAGLVVPRFVDFAARSQLAAGGQQAAALLGFARHWALSRGVAVMVTWEQSGAVVSAEADPEGSPGEFTPLQAGRESRLALPEGITIASLQAGEGEQELPYESVIYADGTGEDLTVYLEDEAGHRQRVDYQGRLGRARVQAGEEADEKAPS